MKSEIWMWIAAIWVMIWLRGCEIKELRERVKALESERAEIPAL